MKSRFYIGIVFCAIFGFLLMQCQDMSNETETFAKPEFYQERHRPQFHFSPKEKWMNDPNGMVYYQGEYHLFYQYYPDSTVWGPMHWGHAISKDLVHWEHLPIALYPDSSGYIFSGSAVVDWNNSSGLGTSGEPPLIAIFTYHDVKGEKAGTDTFQEQAIAYSTDKGRTWTKYAGNPVIPNPGIRDFRDPKVIWDAESEQWIMVLAAGNQVKIYGSQDLKEWRHLSDFGEEYGSHAGVWECPDLFPLWLEEENRYHWVLLLSINPGGPNGGSATQYFVGDFDGRQFVLDERFRAAVEKSGKGMEQAIWLDYGRDNYAGVTWSDVPNEDGRRIFIGWMSNWDYAKVVPTETWRSAMTCPRSLTLRPTNAGPRLVQNWVAELKTLETGSTEIPRTKVSNTFDLIDQRPDGAVQSHVELKMKILSEDVSSFGITLFSAAGDRYILGYSVAEGHFFSDRRKAGDHSFSDAFASEKHIGSHQFTGDTVNFDILIDRSSIELLADNGSLALTELFFPISDFNRVTFFSQGGEVEVSGSVKQVASIW